MDKKSLAVWDDQWRSMRANAYAETELDSFAKKAFSCFIRWISPEDTSVLEAGCGTGRYCIAIAKKYGRTKVTGLDITPGAISLAREGARGRGLENARFVRGDVLKMPFADRTFDAVFSDGVIEHLRDYETAVLEMIRVTKKGGKVIVAVPNILCYPHTLYKKIIGDRFEYVYERSFSQEELIRMFKKAGLKEIETSGFAPAHSIERLKTYYPPMYWIGKAVELGIVMPFDLLSGNFVSRAHGLEICIKGTRQ